MSGHADGGKGSPTGDAAPAGDDAATGTGSSSQVPGNAENTHANAEISEDLKPGQFEPFTYTTYSHEEHEDNTRRDIAYILLLILGVLVVVGSVGWLCHGQDIERIQSFGVLFAPVVTLIGTVLGFYFSNSGSGK